MSKIRLNTYQTSNYNEKSYGDCSCGKCSSFTKRSTCKVGELQSGSKQCCVTCPSQPKCISPDPSACPTISNSTGSNLGFQSDTYKQLNKVAQNQIQCEYDTNIIKDSTAFNKYINEFKYDNEDNPDYYLPLMNYCLSDTNSANCNISTYDGKRPSKCPIMLSNTDDGDQCRSMYLNTLNSDQVKLMESKMQSYCQKDENIELPACYCLSALIPDANKFSGVINAAESSNITQQSDTKCWFTPCRPSLANTLTDILLPKENLDTSSCPTIDCGNFINLYNDPELDNIDFTQVINCSGSPDASSSNDGDDNSSGQDEDKITKTSVLS